MIFFGASFMLAIKEKVKFNDKNHHPRFVLKNMVREDVQVNQVNEFFKIHRENYEKFIGNGVDKQRPEKCSFCSTCEWQEECEKIWIKEDNLNQMFKIIKLSYL